MNHLILLYEIKSVVEMECIPEGTNWLDYLDCF